MSNGRGNADFSLRWQKPGDELKTNVPSFTYPINSSRDVIFSDAEVNVISGNQIRLQYLNLGYDFLRNKHKKHISDLNIFLNISDIGIIWRANKAGIDPDDLTYINQNPTFSLGLKTNLK